MIQIKNLRKQYDSNTVALENINLEFQEGEFIALLGPSGCGKTTTLNCLAGLIEPSDGKILVNGEDITDLPPRERNIGMVFQSYALYPHMKVIDNIAFPLKQMGVHKAKRHQKASEYAKLLEIESLLNRKPEQLSGGQQQRVAMARALVKEPRLLLLDEPMSNLDARLRIDIREEIRRLQKQLNLTALIVTHDQDEAMSIADRIAILDKGSIQQYATPHVLYHEPANLFVAKFLGNPPMNFFPAHYDPSTKEISPNGQQAILGVRPHNIEVTLDEKEGFIPITLLTFENLGKEITVHGKIQEQHIRITIQQANLGLIEGLETKLKEKSAQIYIKLKYFHLFDPQSGERVETINLSINKDLIK